MKLLPTGRYQVVVGSNPIRPVKTFVKKMAKVDISKHEFVPKHVKLSEADVEKLLSSYNISKKQLPKILKKDPAIRDFENIEAGNVIKIIRKSATCGESVYYRVVADA